MPKEEKKQSSISPLALIAGALVIVAVTTFAFLQKKEAQDNTPAQPAAAVTPQPASTEPAPSETQKNPQDFRMPPFEQNVDTVALRATMDPGTVSPAAQSAYVIAQQKPKLLAQLPCFCYCDKFGHGSLHDCFVTDHAQNCDICLKEALRADEMDKQGVPASEIRDVIVAQFHPTDHSH